MKFNTSQESYNDPKSAQNHLKWLESEDGQFFQDLLYQTFAERLSKNPEQKILDAACGPGWLTAKLSKDYKNTEGLDGSEPFLKIAKAKNPSIKFTLADLNNSLPYENDSFETIIFSMAAHDVEDELFTLKELYRILKPQGKLMISIVNPYYGHPVGSFEATFLKKILHLPYNLRLHPYNIIARRDRSFTFNKTVKSYFVKMSEHLNRARAAGFILEHMKDLESTTDSPKRNMHYRLYRYPTLLYFEFKKPQNNMKQ
ncbi:MAG: class I SAM-dependent methyltransferase [Candidatus Doudnabacteria bacterium]